MDSSLVTDAIQSIEGPLASIIVLALLLGASYCALVTAWNLATWIFRMSMYGQLKARSAYWGAVARRRGEM